MSNDFKINCQLCGKEITNEPYFALENKNSKRRGDIDYCNNCENERKALVEKFTKVKKDLKMFMYKFSKIWENRI